MATQTLVQIIVALIAGTSPIIVEMIRGRRPAAPAPSAPDGPPPGPGDPGRPTAVVAWPRPGRDFLELSVLLVCAAIFSALLTDAILISGQVLTLGLEVLFEIGLLTLGTTAVLVVSWWQRRSELAVGLLAFGTLIVLALAPGEPRGAIAKDEEAAARSAPAAPAVARATAEKRATIRIEASDPAENRGTEEPRINFLIPVMVLVFLASTATMYRLGVPTRRLGRRRLESLAAAMLAGLVVLGSAILGGEYRTEALTNPKAPRLRGTDQEKDDAQKLLRSLIDRPLRDRADFYQLGSEVALAPYYLDTFLSTEEARKAREEPPRAPEGVVSPREKSVGSPRAMETETEKQERARAETWQIVQSLQELSSGLRLNLLEDRLDWIHPTVKERNEPVALPVPGTIARERYRELSDGRIAQALTLVPNRAEIYLNSFSYNKRIVDFVQQPGHELGDFVKREIQKRVGADDRTPIEWVARVFPSPSGPHADLLLRELALPADEEVRMAYTAYRKSAVPAGTRFSKAWESFQKLYPRQQRAFIDNVARPRRRGEPWKVDHFAGMVQLAGINPFPLPGELLNSPGANLRLADAIDAETGAAAKAEPGPAAAAGRDGPKPAEPEGKAAGTNAPATRPSGGIAEALKQAVTALDRSDRSNNAALATFFKELDPWTHLGDLFHNDVVEFVNSSVGQLSSIDQLDADTKAPDLKANFLEILSDPITPVVQSLARRRSEADSSKAWEADDLKAFEALTRHNKEQVLDHLAITMYQSTGKHGLDDASLMLVWANVLSPLLAYACAALMRSPLVLIAVCLGAWSSRKLVERDRARELIMTESKHQDDPGFILGIPVELQGRQSVIERLGKLSAKGWSTIAVVGRRGVGKSRILYELCHPSTPEAVRFAIGVWISAPTQFNEEDFIESALEQLVSHTERAVANYLMVEPYEVRRLEIQMARATFVGVAVGLAILSIILYTMNARLYHPEIQATWLPVGLVAVVGVVVFLVHGARLQPVDLSNWLERDRFRNPHTVLLYRRAQRAFAFLRARRSAGGSAWYKDLSPGQQFVAWMIMGPAMLFGVVVLLTVVYAGSGGIYFLAILGFIAVVYVLARSKSQGASRAASSLMSLVAEYRHFAAEVVERLMHGALGDARTVPRVVVCIDELDKIVAFDEIRTFIRRVKAIFEVPGVFYYISLSEDALAALYLGPAEGKNEIDSSLDHVVRIPPLSRRECRRVVDLYLQHRSGELRPRLLDLMVLVSFGIPRDAIRRCDELLADPGRKLREPGEVLAKLIADQATIAAEAYGWSRERVLLTRQPSPKLAVALRQLLGQPSGEREWRTLILLLVYCYLDAALALKDAKSGDVALERLYEIGYRLPFVSLSDLLTELDAIKSVLDDTQPAPSAGNARPATRELPAEAEPLAAEVRDLTS